MARLSNTLLPPFLAAVAVILSTVCAHVNTSQLQLVHSATYTDSNIVYKFPMQIQTYGALNEAYIGTDETNCAEKDATGANVKPIPTKGYVEWPFTLTEGGMYSISGKFMSPDSLANSMFVQFDTDSKLTWNMGKSTVLKQQSVKVDGPGSFTEVCYPLDAGAHTLRFYVREPGAGVHSIEMSKVGPLSVEEVIGCSPVCRHNTDFTLTITLLNFCGATHLHDSFILLNGEPCETLTQVSEDVIQCHAHRFPDDVKELLMSINTTSSSIQVDSNSFPRFAFETKEKPFPWWVILIIVLILSLLLLLIPVVWKVQKMRRTAFAPKDEKKPFGVAMIVLKKESLLLELFPEMMKENMKQCSASIRTLLATHKTYEVKKIGESFVVAANDPQDLLNFVTAVKKEVQKYRNVDASEPDHRDNGSMASSNPSTPSRRESEASTTTPIDTARSGARSESYEQAASSLNSARSGKSKNSFSMHRKKTYFADFAFGVAFGIGKIHHDEETDSYDYTGDVVEAAAVLSDAAAGQQILVSPPVKAAAPPELTSRFHSFCTAQLTSKGTESECFQFNPLGEPIMSFESASRDDDENVDSLAAALRQQVNGVVNKKVTILNVDFVGFEQKAVSMKTAGIEKLLGGFLNDLLAAISTEKGHLQIFSGDHLLITFNAVNPTPLQARRAATIARLLTSAQSDVGDVRMGLTSGQCAAGRFSDGTQTIHTCTGTALSDSFRLLKLCKKYRQSLLVSGPVVQELDMHVVVNVLDVVYLSPPEKTKSKPTAIATIHSFTKEVAEDEWMYQLESGAAQNPFALSNACFEDILSADDENVVPLINDFFTAHEAMVGKNNSEDNGRKKSATALMVQTGISVLAKIRDEYKSLSAYAAARAGAIADALE